MSPLALDIIKWCIAIALTAGCMVIIPLSCRIRPSLCYVWLALLAYSSIADPLTTAHFFHDQRHNVRGWEFSWPEMLSAGLLLHGIMTHGFSRTWLSMIMVAWLIHLGIGCLSALHGINGLFSSFYLFRHGRMLVVLGYRCRGRRSTLSSSRSRRGWTRFMP